MSRPLQPDYNLNCVDMAVSECKRARSMNHLDPFLNGPAMDYPSYSNNLCVFTSHPLPMNSGGIDGCSVTAESFETEPSLEAEWPSAGLGCGVFGSEIMLIPVVGTMEEPIATEKISAATTTSGSGSFIRKRNYDYEAGEMEDGCMEKKKKKRKKKKTNKLREWEEEGDENSKTAASEIKGNTKNRKSKKEDSSNESSKVTEVQKTDYIHVRARRGQATDSHSLAERVRREKISERMKYLQDLVPGCNKITGKAGMLDEIINYVQSLQRQIEFLSMKLAVVNPTLDFNIDDIFPKEGFSGPTVPDSPNMAMPLASSAMVNSGYIQLNPMQDMVSCSGFSSSSNLVIPRQTTIDSSCFNNGQVLPMWDSDMHNLYSTLPSTTFPSQPFSGCMSTGNLKMEM